jgi:electron transport complex protein RnfD
MAFVGGVAAIGLGKLIWGGLGHNLFNPALVGRAFLQAAFPTALTTWHTPGDPLSLRGATFALPFLQAGKVDGTTAATPLNLMREELTPSIELLTGDVAGSVGETSAGVILVAGLYLLVRRALDYRIPAAMLLSVGLFSGVLHLAAPDRYPPPLFMLLAGSLLYGAVFMATDPVTTPLAPRGAWIFGLGVGVLVVLIRIWGSLPEGVMYAILLMNAATPLLDRVTQPRVFGRGRKP